MSTDSKSVPRKRVLEHGCCGCFGFPRDFKRPKVILLREIPSNSGAYTTRISRRGREDVGGVGRGVVQVTSSLVSRGTKEIIMNEENGGQGPSKVLREAALVPPVGREYSPPKMRHGVSVHPRILPGCGIQIRGVNDLGKVEKPYGRKYPPPKMRHGVPVHPQFPPGKKLEGSTSKEIAHGIQGEEYREKTSMICSSGRNLLQSVTDSIIVQFDDDQEVVSRNEVMEALNQFEQLFKKLSQVYKAKPRGKRKTTWNILIESANLLKLRQKWVNRNKQVGAVPGVKVGDQFQFRVELAIIGLHHKFISGIDYVEKDGITLATSIVDSGRYENESELSDVLIYSGNGGNPQIFAVKKPQDQKLERGNLDLKNSMVAGTPVRVIRGYHSFKNGKTYIYDGLYIVHKSWEKRGGYGKLVYMFLLNRIPGQPKLSLNIVGRSRRSKDYQSHCVVADISEGKEEIDIRVMNDINGEKPPPFNYITDMFYPELDVLLSMPSSCDCIDGCIDSEHCSCAVKNGHEILFDDNRVITKRNSIIYECGPMCKCPSSCKNRVSQRKVQYQLEIFRTETRRWGVRSRNFISAGSFVCEYAGEVFPGNEVGERTRKDEYLFHIGNNYDNHMEENGFVVDAEHFGNIGRFIHHSCSPNLYAQNVFYDHDDKRMPHVMLFATKDIRPRRELTCNYSFKNDKGCGINGDIKECCGGAKKYLLE